MRLYTEYILFSYMIISYQFIKSSNQNMKASDNLFQLIKSLTKSEKGHFKKFVSITAIDLTTPHNSISFQNIFYQDFC